MAVHRLQQVDPAAITPWSLVEMGAVVVGVVHGQPLARDDLGGMDLEVVLH